jgi:hypothetical protein
MDDCFNVSPGMKKNRSLRTLALLFVAVLAFYVIAYAWIEHRRSRQGPWQVLFTNDSSGAPLVVIDQPFLAISNVQIRFADAALPTNFSGKKITFARPRPVPYELPFGECIFMDTTFQPGSVVLRVQGHEVQLLPRVLTVDRQEHAWRSGEALSASAMETNAPAR